jgi:hypothetical protein
MVQDARTWIRALVYVNLQVDAVQYHAVVKLGVGGPESSLQEPDEVVRQLLGRGLVKLRRHRLH